MGRRGRSKRNATPYSKVDIREQYCINKKQVQVLESNSSSALFGCLSKHHDSSCHTKHSLLTKCVDRVPSDENLHESSRQPLPRRPVEDLERAYLRRRPKSVCATDPRRYAWIPEDEESCRMEMGRSVIDDMDFHAHEYSMGADHPSSTCPAHYLPPPPPPPASAARTKHVSFARSHTLTSFDDAMMGMRTPPQAFKSQERLILSTTSGKRVGPPVYQSYEQRVTKKPPMKTQATQTGVVGKEPPNYLSLSPRTVHRGTPQPNSVLPNGRKLMKSFSEAGGCHFGVESAEERKDHDLLTRTQSEEPRSPYMKTSALPWPDAARGHHAVPQQDRNKKVYKEIFIDFEPADIDSRSRQSYGYSDGEYMSDYNMEEDFIGPVVDRVDGVKVSLSSYSSVQEGDVANNAGRISGLGPPQDSVDEEFHENFLYNAMFQKQQSTESEPREEVILHSGECSPEGADTIAVPSHNTLTVSRKVSPFASSDSLTTDHRADVSDGIWSESQSTVLQAESENGTISKSSRRHMLLLQHQQRSSIDTEEVLDDDLLQTQNCLSPPQKKVPSVTIASVHHYENIPKETRSIKASPKYSPISSNEARRKAARSPDKDLQPPGVQRRDSGRITDISETSTTEDYATAHENSCENSLRQQQGSKTGSKEGSSFESASSLPGNARDETNVQGVPLADTKANLVKEVAKSEEETASVAESSSSGSYSIESCHKDPREWTDQERTSVKKGFKLNLSDQSGDQDPGGAASEDENQSTPTSSKKPKAKTVSRKSQSQAKKWNSNKGEEIVPGMVRSPAMPEGFKAEEWAPPQRTTPTPEEIHPPKIEAEVTSDESSCDHKCLGMEDLNGHSPRRQRKRGAGRGRRSADNRGRRPPAPTATANNTLQLSPSNYCRSPLHSPKGSPKKNAKEKLIDAKKNDGETVCHLKAVSAESLRSVSPGSDSVFYNEADPHMLCHQCGRQVDTEKPEAKTEPVPDIVQPPPRFADSPESSHSKSARIFKKQEKRLRSEERTAERRRHPRPRSDLRAKSEERGKEKKKGKDKLRPYAHSTDASLEILRGAESSPSISDPFTEDDQRVFADAFKKASWISIVDEVYHYLHPSEESKKFPFEIIDDSSAELSPTEKEFNKRFQAARHRMVHRKSSIDMIRRLQENTFDSINLAERLQQTLRLMLMVWCTQIKALSTLGNECDKKVIVKRKSGEFGFRIHGARPVVVSGIEPDTHAETSGLQVGDIVLAVNGISVLEASHSDVVKLAHSGFETLEVEVARSLSALITCCPQEPLHAGFLHKLSADKTWHSRWFVLRSDNCLYYYHTQAERQPLGAVLLFNYTFALHSDGDRPHCFSIRKQGARTLELSAETEEELSVWRELLEKAMSTVKSRQGEWYEMSCKLLHQPASAISQPDCFGHLTRMEDKWRRRYCVLKDAALIIYVDSAADKASAVVCLQGYRVQTTGTSTKKFHFEIVPPEQGQKHFYFYTDTDMDKKRWVAAIEYSIDHWIKVG